MQKDYLMKQAIHDKKSQQTGERKKLHLFKNNMCKTHS